MILWCTFRVMLGFAWGCLVPSSPCLSLGALFLLRRRTKTYYAWYCAVQQRNCLMFLEVSPELHNCSSKVIKAKDLPADSTLQSSGNNCWIKQRGKKFPVGPQSKLESQKQKQDPEESYWETMRKKLLIYEEQKPESSRNSKLLPHPINIFSSTYGMSLSQLPPPDIPVSDYP